MSVEKVLSLAMWNHFLRATHHDKVDSRNDQRYIGCRGWQSVLHNVGRIVDDCLRASASLPLFTNEH